MRCDRLLATVSSSAGKLSRVFDFDRVEFVGEDFWFFPLVSGEGVFLGVAVTLADVPDNRVVVRREEVGFSSLTAAFVLAAGDPEFPERVDLRVLGDISSR